MRHHVQLGFGVIIFLMVLATVGVLFQTHHTNEIVTNLVEVSNAKIEHVITMRDAIRLRVNSLSIMLSTKDPFERDEQVMRFYNYAALFIEARTKLVALPMNDREKVIHAKLSRALHDASPYTIKVVELASAFAADDKLAEASKLAHIKREPLFEVLNELVHLQQDYGRQALKKSRELNADARWVTVSISLLVLIIALSIATFVSRTTSRKNKQLVKAYQEAEAATRSKSTFLANMSHEIRTPITAIIGFAESTFFSDQTMEMRQRSIRTVIESGRHLLQVVNDVLDISKIEANKLDIEIGSANLSDIIAGAVAIVKPLAQEKSLEFSIHYTYPLPAKINTDPFRLKQIILNLCSNAIKFTDEGHVHLNVDYIKARNKLLIEVVDTGIGLSEDQIKEIFEPFKQADSAISRRYGGTGLGLTLSRQLAMVLHGNIEVESEQGKGSCFTLAMDVGEINDAELTYTLAKTPDTDDGIDTIDAINSLKVTGRVLVVDDNIVNQQLLSLFLKRIDVDYAVVENGQLAVEKALTEDFDLILMDIQMPVMDGITATKRLRQQGYCIPIVALTANTQEEDRQNCLNAGCNDFLTKPIDIKTFFKVVTAHINGYTADDNQAEPVYPICSRQDPGLASLIDGFVKLHLPAMQRDIDNAIQQADWEKLRHKLHELKGTAGNVGYLVLMDVAKQMEFQVLNQNQKELKRLFGKLQGITQRINAGIESTHSKTIGDKTL